ncbi:Uncharacterized protein TPAR_00836 [Tolypocladium paradoxum]|uniref:Aminoglycoside phosphotransferase domain-containing protein n=1 Tax=Tolypocladium paradoxum TaxID=94208 RepID=A0A2S4L944_9HYPO|nr:Uncharacterized protein TPAR_00836 [Tolypocladium paradoxum]
MEAIMAHLSRQQISEFFSKCAPTTQQQCDQEAKRIVGGAIHPAPVQGGASYTNDGALVVQFRAGRSALDLDLLGYIQQTYGGFVPRHELAGRLGELWIYTMDNIGGVAMYLAREQLHQHNCRLLHQTVKDFALSFNTIVSSPKISQLAEGLPKRFRPSLEHLTANLPRLCAKGWPMVPNHNDLLENNIHVNPETGHIMGICDWKDTTIGPFGLSLGGLETMLGIRRIRGWYYHPNQQELRDLFWGTFYDAIGQLSEEQRELVEVARMTGIFLENGFEGDGDGNRFSAIEGNETLDYLGAVTLGLSAQVEQ